jgi:osmotically-inducible protein OsmY
MNQRDQNQSSGRRGGGRQQETSSSGRPQGGRYGRGQALDESSMREERDWQSQQRYGGSRMSGGSAGQRFGETYNPEPQWLRDDRDYGGGSSYASGGSYARDEDEFGSEYRSSGESGRGSYASSGRPWGEQQARDYQRDYQGYGQGQGSQGYGGSYGSRQYGSQQYDSQQQYGSQQQYDRYGASQGGFGGPSYGSQNFQRNMGGRGTQSGYGASRGGGGMNEYGTPGYETAGYDSELGYSGQSMSGRGYGSEYRSGSSSGYGSGGYGSSSGYQLGSQQRDSGYQQRSYRGLGPQNYQRADDRIRDDVHEKLTESDEIDARNIMVDVNQGNVTLTGTVPERRMRYAAEDLVEGCMGVSNINNQLKVQREEERSSLGSSSMGSSSSSSGSSLGSSTGSSGSSLGTSSSSMGSSSGSLGASSGSTTGSTTGTGTAGTGGDGSSSSTSTESKRH